METFSDRDGELYAEGVALSVIATRFGTPCYVYSRAAIEQQFRAFDTAFGTRPHRVCYSVKANSTLAVLNVLARLGAGFDIVSGGELERVCRAGGDPRNVIFSGVGKSAVEMRQALALDIGCFNVESEAELERLNDIAGALGKRAPVSLRVNPDVDAQTHPYISTGLRDNKFGIDIRDALRVYERAAALPHIVLVGVDCHIGSQLTELAPFADALQHVMTLVEALNTRGIVLRHIDCGGGIGIRYRDEQPPTPAAYVAALCSALQGRGEEILIEPGRAIVGDAGVLLTRVEYLKLNTHKNFAIVDAAMNDLIRPALYDAWMDIVPLARATRETRCYDVVGPVCESGDFLGKDRALALAAGDLLAVRAAGAYGFSMSSNYNTRPRPAEVMVDGDQAILVRCRESLADLMIGETLLPLA
ncbi:MAG: diaminopimelate decarboxylase [Gammaproteobacteria bacterium]